MAALSLAQSVSRGHAGALLQKATQQSAGVAAQHFCLLTDREDGAVLVERTHCGAQTSAGSKEGGDPPDGGEMKSYSSGPPCSCA